jgi:hypothetical protein
MLGLPKLAIYMVLASVFVGAALVLYNTIDRRAYIRGQDELQTAIQKRNAEAARGAQEARNALDKCYDSNGTWSQSRGVCEHK